MGLIKAPINRVTSRHDNERYRVIGSRRLVSEFGTERDVLDAHGYVFHIIGNGVQSPIAACVVMGDGGFFTPGLYRMGARDEVAPVEIIGAWDSPPIQLKFGFFDDYYDLARNTSGNYNQPPNWIRNQPRHSERVRSSNHRQLKLGYQDASLIF